jgi:hypothetical protein
VRILREASTVADDGDAKVLHVLGRQDLLAYFILADGHASLASTAVFQNHGALRLLGTSSCGLVRVSRRFRSGRIERFQCQLVPLPEQCHAPVGA